MSEVDTAQYKEIIENVHGSTSVLVQTVPVHKVSEGKLI